MCRFVYLLPTSVQLRGNSGGHLAWSLARLDLCEQERLLHSLQALLSDNQNITTSASSPKLDPVFIHLFIYLFLFPCSRGSREAGRHALWVRALRHPHSTHPPSEQIRHPGTPPQAVEMEEEEEREVQADLCRYIFLLILQYVNI